MLNIYEGYMLKCRMLMCVFKGETFMHVAMQNLIHGYHTYITAGQQKILINTMLYVRPLSEICNNIWSN